MSQLEIGPSWFDLAVPKKNYASVNFTEKIGFQMITLLDQMVLPNRFYLKFKTGIRPGENQV